MVFPLFSFIGLTNLLNVLLVFYNFSVIITKLLKFKTFFQGLLLWVRFFQKFHLEVFSFGVLVLILVLFVVDLFACINLISVHWSWNVFLGVIENYLWYIYKHIHTPLLPPQACGRSWWGLWLGVDYSLYKFIALIDQKYPPSSSH